MFQYSSDAKIILFVKESKRFRGDIPPIMIFKRGSGDRWVAFIFPLSNTQGIFWKGGGALWREKVRHTQN